MFILIEAVSSEYTEEHAHAQSITSVLAKMEVK